MTIHSKFSTHVDHHKETHEDISLRRNRVSLDDDKYRGIAFSWKTSLFIALFATVQALALAVYCGVCEEFAITTTVIAALYQGCVWNTMHPQMHGLDDVELSYGPPTIHLFPSWFLCVLIDNHRMHHASRGSKRFNVTLLGADFIFGTW